MHFFFAFNHTISQIHSTGVDAEDAHVSFGRAAFPE
jgi:hypothetical protein